MHMNKTKFENNTYKLKSSILSGAGVAKILTKMDYHNKVWFQHHSSSCSSLPSEIQRVKEIFDEKGKVGCEDSFSSL